jgi:hypothetical protein
MLHRLAKSIPGIHKRYVYKYWLSTRLEEKKQKKLTLNHLMALKMANNPWNSVLSI